MNRTLLTAIFTVFLTASAISQLSVSANYDRSTEISNDLKKHFFGNASGDWRVQNLFGLTVDYNYKQVLFSGGFSFFENGDPVTINLYHSYSGSSAIPSYTMKEYYTEKIDFKGSNIRFAIEYLFKWKSPVVKSVESHLSFGLVFQADYTTHFRESDQYRSNTLFNYNNPEHELQMYSKEEMTFSDPMVSPANIQSLGLVLNKRWIRNGLFLNLRIAAGFTSVSRFSFTQPYRFYAVDRNTTSNNGHFVRDNGKEKFGYYFTTGISVGYRFGVSQIRTQLPPDPVSGY